MTENEKPEDNKSEEESKHSDEEDKLVKTNTESKSSNPVVRIIRFFVPPLKWRVPVIILMGVIFGLFLVFFQVSGGTSYLSSEPEVCLNCHIMTTEYMGWLHGSHKTAAPCVDCHIPQDNFADKWLTKGKTGLRHMSVWIMQNEPHVIRATESSKSDIIENCLRCHSDIMNTMKLVETSMDNVKKGENKLCWDCHREIGHGKMSSLTLTPNALINIKAPRTAGWLSTNSKDKDK